MHVEGEIVRTRYRRASKRSKRRSGLVHSTFCVVSVVLTSNAKQKQLCTLDERKAAVLANSICNLEKDLYICEIHSDARDVSRMAGSADEFLLSQHKVERHLNCTSRWVKNWKKRRLNQPSTLRNSLLKSLRELSVVVAYILS